jgi:hypothetical protein
LKKPVQSEVTAFVLQGSAGGMPLRKSAAAGQLPGMIVDTEPVTVVPCVKKYGLKLSICQKPPLKQVHAALPVFPGATGGVEALAFALAPLERDLAFELAR